MADGRRHESRIHAVQQAAIVWCLNDLDMDEFIRRGQLPGEADKRIVLSPELEAMVDRHVAQIMQHGKLIVPTE